MTAWAGCIAREGTPTGDGRMLAPGSLTWSRLPRNLIDASQVGRPIPGGVVGRVDWVLRHGLAIWAGGETSIDLPALGVGVAVDLMATVLTGEPGDLVVCECELAAVTLTEQGAWGCRIYPVASPPP